MVSHHSSFKHGRASLAVMEGLESIEEIEMYLEAATCINCHNMASVLSMVERRCNDLEESLGHREHKLKFMEENSIAWEKKACEMEINLELLISERGKLSQELQALKSQNSKLLREVEVLHTELERRPEDPPAPPPPPPPPPKFRLHFWKPTKKQRSKSLNRVEDLRSNNPHAPMVLNSDILDAIKNRRYSLRHVDPIKEKEKTERLRKESDMYYSDFNIAKILERQIALAFSSDEEEDCEEDWIMKNQRNEKDNGSFSSLDSNGSFSHRYKSLDKKFSSF